MHQKETFKTILIWTAIILVVLPPFAALNSFMTKWLDHSGWYAPIEKYIVPWESRLVAGVISPFGIKTVVTPGLDQEYSFYMVKDTAAVSVDLAWNCLGWQSVLLFIASLLSGLKGSYSVFSRSRCVIFGLLGTLILNVFRMSFIALGAYYANPLIVHILHDYFAAFITLIWLIFFWWFSYSYLLEERLTTA
jgi:exosortase/archaeosortase family protein